MHPNFCPLLFHMVLTYLLHRDTSVMLGCFLLECRILIYCKPTPISAQLLKAGHTIVFRKVMFHLLWLVLKAMTSNMSIFNVFLAVFLSMVSFT